MNKKNTWFKVPMYIYMVGTKFKNNLSWELEIQLAVDDDPNNNVQGYLSQGHNKLPPNISTIDICSPCRYGYAHQVINTIGSFCRSVLYSWHLPSFSDPPPPHNINSKHELIKGTVLRDCSHCWLLKRKNFWSVLNGICVRRWTLKFNGNNAD